MNDAVVIGIGVLLSFAFAIWASIIDVRTLRIPNNIVLLQVVTTISVLLLLQEWVIFALWFIAWAIVVALGFFIGDTIEKYYLGFGDIKFIVALFPIALLLQQGLLFLFFLALSQVIKAINKGGAFAPFILTSFLFAVSFQFI